MPPDDLRSHYGGRWVALLGDRVVGVGRTRQEAYLAAKRSRPKQEPSSVEYVSEDAERVQGVQDAGRFFTADELAGQVRDLLAVRTEAYIVGGSVRDFFLGRVSHDLDFVVPADALELGRLIAAALAAPFYVLDEARGTGRVVVARGAGAEPTFVDIATLRGGSIEADLAVRDFTVNAMALDVAGALLDPHGGQRDLAERRLRLVAPQGIRDDPIRALRAVRQAAELGFSIEPATEAIISQDGAGLARISGERVRDELVKLLLMPDAGGSFGRIERLGLLPAALPEMAPTVDVTQSPPHRLSVWEHSLLAVTRWEQVVAALLRGQPDGFLAPLDDIRPALAEHLQAPMANRRPRWAILKLIALLHDAGKPAHRSGDPGARIRFIGHDRGGSAIAGDAMRRLRFARSEIVLAETVVRHHMRPITLAQAGDVSVRAAHRLFRDTGVAGVDLALLSLADTWALSPGPGFPPGWEPALRVASKLLHHWLADGGPEQQPALLTGSDLMACCGIAGGPEVGRWLRRVREAQVSGELHSREEAIRWVREAERKERKRESRDV